MRTHDMGGGAKLLVWFASFGIAIGVIYGIRKWRDHSKETDARLESALAVRSQLGDVMRCLGGYESSDLLKTVTVRVMTSAMSNTDCDYLLQALAVNANEVAARLGAGYQPRGALALQTLLEPGGTQRFCEWYASMHENVEALVAKAGGTTISPLGCEVSKDLKLLAAPPLESRADPSISIDEGLLVVAIDDTTRQRTMFHTTDGATWNTRTVPTDGWPWTNDGTVVLSGVDRGAAKVQVFDHDAWSERTTLKLPVVDDVAVSGDRITIVSHDERNYHYVAHVSTDGGKTFAAPVRVFKSPQRSPSAVVVHAMADGTAIGRTSSAGPANFEGFWLATGAKTPERTLGFTWEEEGDGLGYTTCTAGDTVWVLVRNRYVVVTHDGGKTWSDVTGGMERSISRPTVACTKERLGIVDDVGANRQPFFHVCTNQCTPYAVPAGKWATIGIRLDPVELILAGNPAGSFSAGGKPLTAIVFRIDGGLVPDRVGVIETDGRIPVMRDGSHFVQLQYVPYDYDY